MGNQILITGGAGFMDAILEGTLDLGPLLTHRVPLGQCDAAFQLMRHRPEGFLKAVVAP